MAYCALDDCAGLLPCPKHVGVVDRLLVDITLKSAFVSRFPKFAHLYLELWASLKTLRAKTLRGFSRELSWTEKLDSIPLVLNRFDEIAFLLALVQQPQGLQRSYNSRAPQQARQVRVMQTLFRRLLKLRTDVVDELLALIKMLLHTFGSTQRFRVGTVGTFASGGPWHAFDMLCCRIIWRECNSLCQVFPHLKAIGNNPKVFAFAANFYWSRKDSVPEEARHVLCRIAQNLFDGNGINLKLRKLRKLESVADVLGCVQGRCVPALGVADEEEDEEEDGEEDQRGISVPQQ